MPHLRRSEEKRQRTGALQDASRTSGVRGDVPSRMRDAAWGSVSESVGEWVSGWVGARKQKKIPRFWPLHGRIFRTENEDDDEDEDDEEDRD